MQDARQICVNNSGGLDRVATLPAVVQAVNHTRTRHPLLLCRQTAKHNHEQSNTHVRVTHVTQQAAELRVIVAWTRPEHVAASTSRACWCQYKTVTNYLKIRQSRHTIRVPGALRGAKQICRNAQIFAEGS